MPLAPVDISAGQVSQVDVFSPATSLVRNWQTDGAGVNHVRPALATYTTTGLGTSPLAALYRWKKWIVAVDTSRNIWALNDAAPSTWTAITDSTDATTKLDGNSRPMFAEDPSDLFIAGGRAIQKWTGVGFSARLGGGSPNATHIVNIGERMVANNLANTSGIYWSAAGDGGDSTWTGEFSIADSRPDPIVAISENNAEMTLFGTSTTETWGISVDPTNPYQRIVAINVGMSAPYSAIRFDQHHAWLDDKRRFVMSDGRSITPLSDAIARDLRDLSTVSDCWGYREETNQYGLLVWVFPIAGRTFAYDYGTKKWCERSSYDSGLGAQVALPISSSVYWDALNTYLAASSTSAAVQTLDTAGATDAGTTIVAERITGHQDFGTRNRKRSMRLQVCMRRGTTPLAAVGNQVELAVEDDGRGFGAWNAISMGQPDDLITTASVWAGGVFRSRRYWIRYSGTEPMSLVSLHDDVADLGS